MTLTFALPMPPSLNNAYVNVRGRGRVKSAAFKAWITEAGWEIKLQWPPLPKGKVIFTGPIPVKVDIAFEKPKRRSDLDNRAKPLLDLLTAMYVWSDDSQAHDLRLRWADVKGCVVTVEEMP